MKKIIIYSTIFFIVGTLISPVLGMAIGETRNIILGLAPQEAVLSLADEIDKSRIENETKIQEMQAKIEEQQNQIMEQNEKLTQQQEDVNLQTAEIKTTQAEVVKSRDCSADVNKYCVSDSFREADKFDNFLKVYKDSFDKDAYEKYKKQFTEQYNNCQKSLLCK